MKILIIGGSGLIGQALTRELNQNNHVLTLLTRKEIDLTDKRGVIWKHWDGKSAESLQPLLSGQDAVVNLSGESIGKGSWTSERKEILLQSRIEPIGALVKAWSVVDLKPSVLIQASAVGYYGTGDAACDESSPAGRDFLSALAINWEDASRPIADTNVRRVLVRTGVVLAKEGGVLAQLTLPFKFFVGGPIGKGSQWLSWIHIDDEVRAIRFLIESKTLAGVFNLSAPNPVTNAQAGKALGNVMKRPYWFPVPGFLLKLALGEMSTLVLDGQKVLPTRLLQAGFKFKFEKIEQAFSDLLS